MRRTKGASVSSDQDLDGVSAEPSEAPTSEEPTPAQRRQFKIVVATVVAVLVLAVIVGVASKGSDQSDTDAVGPEQSEEASDPVLDRVNNCYDRLYGVLQQAHSPGADMYTIYYELGSTTPEGRFMSVVSNYFRSESLQLGVDVASERASSRVFNGCVAIEWDVEPSGNAVIQGGGPVTLLPHDTKPAGQAIVRG